jgi:hypothetical protein
MKGVAWPCLHQRRGEQNDAKFYVASAFVSEKGEKWPLQAVRSHPLLGSGRLAARCPEDHRWRGALALTTGLWNPTALLAGSSTVAPNPIPAGIKFEGELFHVFPPAPGVEIATITDFVGTIGATAVQGTGVGVNHDGQSMVLNFGADMRFMRGLYIGVDGRPHQATFGFI